MKGVTREELARLREQLADWELGELAEVVQRIEAADEIARRVIARELELTDEDEAHARASGMGVSYFAGRRSALRLALALLGGDA